MGIAPLGLRTVGGPATFYKHSARWGCYLSKQVLFLYNLTPAGERKQSAPCTPTHATSQTSRKHKLFSNSRS